MQVHSIQKTQYPTDEKPSFQMHIKTLNKNRPFIMIDISEAQYNSLLEVFIENGTSLTTEQGKYCTVNLVETA